MTDPSPSAADTSTVDALRRVKAAETEWEERLTAARAQASAAVDQARAGAEDRLRSVAAELEANRSHALEAAGIAADTDARQILTDGESAAARARTGASRKLSDRREQVLAAVLGEFASD